MFKIKITKNKKTLRDHENKFLQNFGILSIVGALGLENIRYVL